MSQNERLTHLIRYLEVLQTVTKENAFTAKEIRATITEINKELGIDIN